MIDLHSHLLPGIDDGARDLEQSIALAQAAASAGTRHMVMTPHLHPGRWENYADDIAVATEQFREVLSEVGVDLQISFAAEVRLSDQVIPLVEAGRVPFFTRGGSQRSQTLLLEFPHGQIVPGSLRLCSWLLDRGITPLIPHPERNRKIMRQWEVVDPFLEVGCQLQLTAGSVLGEFGDGARAAALHFLDTGKAHVIASDAHHLERRPPQLDRCYTFVSERYGVARANELFLVAPSRILGLDSAVAA